MVGLKLQGRAPRQSVSALVLLAALGATVLGAVAPSTTHAASTPTSTTKSQAAASGGITRNSGSSGALLSQALVRLGATHTAFAMPSLAGKKIGQLRARRPLTGQQTVLPVLASFTSPTGSHWLQVELPGRPNSHTGWINARDTTAAATPWRIVVRTDARRVFVYKAGRLQRSFLAVVGKPSTPTPFGHFFVEEAIALAPSAVGAPYALALSARSTVFQEFDGGPGQVAIHGLANVGGIPGSAASHGCVRIADGAVSWLVVRLGAGTPVTIRR